MNLLLAAVLYFTRPCVPWGDLCVQPYVVEYLPPQPASVAPGASWGPLVAKYWDAELVPWALKIIECESGGDPNAYNPRSGVRGLFQIHPLWQKVWPGDYYDPETNVKVAWLVYLEQGPQAWACKASR